MSATGSSASRRAGARAVSNAVCCRDDSAFDRNARIDGHASSAGAFAALDRQSAETYIVASGLKHAAAGPAVRFSDIFLMDARTVTSAYAEARTEGGGWNIPVSLQPPFKARGSPGVDIVGQSLPACLRYRQAGRLVAGRCCRRARCRAGRRRHAHVRSRRKNHQ